MKQQKKLQYRSFFNIETIEVSSISKLLKLLILKFLRYLSCMLWYLVSKSKGFDIEVYVLQYRYLNTSILKHLYWISYPILKHFNIENYLKIWYQSALELNITPDIEALWYRSCVRNLEDFSETSISKPTFRYRISNPHTLILKFLYTISKVPQKLRYQRCDFDIEDVTLISKFVSGQSRSLSNESQHPVSFIYGTDLDILCVSRICIM